MNTQPIAWMKNVSIALFLGVAVMLIAWIWLGDWRWGATAGVAFCAGIVFLGLSLSQGKPVEPQGIPQDRI
ncbi:hypothetical protein [Sphaerisporangium sp. TRM90804]|uniref:hypothetical protein n=1 Tax=Sphaerisporangium sp. TRM90804 TaxID=3031113 RepID=UPI00244A2EAB|nr:hypothetical protein [Sphaerisporangium sp. TRM90804]MDH2424758.1 hypothetical protein [Sphaerisporangium sp. TRM90804]